MSIGSVTMARASLHAAQSPAQQSPSAACKLPARRREVGRCADLKKKLTETCQCKLEKFKVVL